MKQKKSSKITTLALAAAALSGIAAGATAYAQPSGNAIPRYAVDKGTFGLGVVANEDDKHDCAGKNSCKGKGGCGRSDNGCKGKNSCKGKGGCATDGSHEES